MAIIRIENFQPYPSRMMHQGLILLLYIFAILYGLSFLALFSGGGAALHLSPPLEFCLDFFTLVGELQLNQMSFGPLPSLPGIHFWSYVERVPLDAKVSGAQQAYLLQSAKCILQCTLPEGGV